MECNKSIGEYVEAIEPDATEGTLQELADIAEQGSIEADEDLEDAKTD